MLSKSVKPAADGSIVIIDKALAAVFKGFASETDRGLVIITGTIIEERLGRLLQKFLIQRKEANSLISRNLSGFEARAKAAYCLGLISRDEYHMVEAIRKLRNQFAHQFVTKTFDGSLQSKRAEVFAMLARHLPGYDLPAFKNTRKAFEAFAIHLITTIWDREHDLEDSDYIIERE